MSDLIVTEVRLTLYNKPESPVKAFCEIVLNGAIRLNDLCLKRNLDGRLLLTYPAKRSSDGQERHFFFPVNKQTEELIRAAVIKEMSEAMKGLNEIVERKR